MFDFFSEADIIHSYSRAQVIKDGGLVDVSVTAKEAGFKYPVAVTRRVWDEVITPDDEDRSDGQSEEGRLWDLIWMCYLAAKRGEGSEVKVSLYVVKGKRKELVHLRSLCGPGDNMEPVITIMFPDES